jgi:hypothetical protein
VRLLDITAGASKVAIDSASHDAHQGLPTSPPIPELYQTVIDSTAAVQTLGSGVANSLKQVVDKTKIVADFVDKAAKVRVALRLLLR